MKTFDFKIQTNMKFGIGLSKKLGDIVKEQGFMYPLVVTDFQIPVSEKIHEIFSYPDFKYHKIYIYEGEPTYDMLDKYMKSIKIIDNWQPDCVIGIGGGSVMDTAKGIATLLTNPGKAISYRGFDKVKNKPLPVIAVPTTAGTGSEVTPFAVFIDTKEKIKLGINTEYNRPIIAILDPELTLTCSMDVTKYSAMDAIIHTTEAYVSKQDNDFMNMICFNAIDLLYPSILEIIEEPNNIHLRSDLLLGSYYAGITLPNSGGGLTGAISYLLGIKYHIPHGLAGTIPFVKVLFKTHEISSKKYKETFGQIIPQCNLDIFEKLDVPKLSKFGAKKSDIDELVEKTMKMKHALSMNPVKFTEDDVREMFEEMI